jgi:presqualene diphosphate synthase
MTASIFCQQALQDVRARVKASRTSFGAGMAVLPREKREAMYALYAFCREVDDIADDGATPEERQKGLQQWRERIRALFQNIPPVIARGQRERSNPVHADDIGTGLLRGPRGPLAMTDSCSNPIVQTLEVALQRFPLVEEDFQAIINGMAMDAGAPVCAPSAATLDLYCDRVASAVGRASVRIFGDDSEIGMRVAHHLGRALQLTNILRDLAEDAARARLYLPQDLLAKHCIATHNPGEVLRHANLPLVCHDLAAQAKAHFIEADTAMRMSNKAAMRPARIMRAYYGAILDRLVAEDWRNPSRRVTLPRWRKLWLMIKNLVG